MNRKLLISKVLTNSLSKYLRVKYLNNTYPALKIINFHRVINGNESDYRKLAGHPTKKEFNHLIRHISQNYNPICLKEFSIGGFETLSKDKINIAITFDDGYLDNLTLAYPILKEHSIPATIFCTTDTLDGKKLWFQELYERVDQLETNEIILDWIDTPITLNNKWDAMEVIANSLKGLSYQETINRIDSIPQSLSKSSKEEMLSWDDLKHFKDSSLITIGAHTNKHWNLTTLDKKELEHELNLPKVRLLKALNYDSIMIAYPNGRYNNQVIEFVKDYHYLSGFIMTRGRNTPNTCIYSLFREYAECNLDLFDFQMHDFDLMLHNLLKIGRNKK